MNSGLAFTFFQYFSILAFPFPKSFSQMYEMINESSFALYSTITCSSCSSVLAWLQLCYSCQYLGLCQHFHCKPQFSGVCNKAGEVGIWPKFKSAGNHAGESTESHTWAVICFSVGSIFTKTASTSEVKKIQVSDSTAELYIMSKNSARAGPDK